MFDKIKLGYPNIWIKDSESSRIIDIVVSTLHRDFYTIDFDSAFSLYQNGTWKSVLVKNPAFEITGGDEYVTTFDPQIAMDYLLNNPDRPKKPSTFLINVIGKPDATIQNYAPFLDYLKSKYRQAFWQDDNNIMPLQLIFVSTQDCPEDYISYFNINEEVIPGPQELATIVTHINSSAHDRLLVDSTIKDVVNAGIGLTESQFIDLCLTSVVNHSKLDPRYIYDQKMSSIKKNGILEIIKPSISFEDIGGLDNIKDIIRRTAKLWSDRDQAKA